MGTLLISLLLLMIVAGIIYTIIRDKKQGRTSCGADCAHCRMCTACGRGTKDQKVR
ncbi:MAG: FeoB-associated Cys-rich membrane protein [Lachnospiraceae bacterium]|nr:FeoB-associated Cys-rich membrane protein [Lachnospiraceae bacterium]